ncbi:MAG: hypothetical protein QM496_10520 [Verrucomicrobiota bacterium]
MKRVLVIPVLLFALFVVGVPFDRSIVVAQGITKKSLPKKLSLLKFNYEVMLADLNKPLGELEKNYENRLNLIAAEFQKQGDLQGILAVKKEVEALGENGVEPSRSTGAAEPQKLVAARKIFLQTQKKLGIPLMRKSASLTVAYRAKLEKLKFEYTKQGRLDDAIAAKTLLDSLPPPGKNALPVIAKRHLKIKVQIDGLSHLFMRGSEIWFDHTEGIGAMAGRHGGDFSTTLDDSIEWKPIWNAKITERYDAGISLPTSGSPVSIHLRFSDGRGTAKVIEKPSQKNDYTAKIEMRDADKGGRRFLGSDWMEFRLKW